MKMNAIVILVFTLYEKRGLTICQSLGFFSRGLRKSVVAVRIHFGTFVSNRVKLFPSLEVIIIALCKLFVINLP